MPNFKNVKSGTYTARITAHDASDHASRGIPVSVGKRDFGKASVDCMLKLSECQRGTLRSLTDEDDSALVLYFHMSLNQPSKYILESAKISLSFDTDDHKVYLTDMYGPKQLSRETRKERIHRVMQRAPQLSVNFPGGGFSWSGLGDVITTVNERDRRWDFWGTHESDGSGPYRAISWTWDSTNLDKDRSVPREPLQCGLVLKYDEVPINVMVQIGGKLKDKAKNFFVGTRAPKMFPYPIVADSLRLNTSRFATLQDDLDDEMILRNHAVLFPREHPSSSTTGSGTNRTVPSAEVQASSLSTASTVSSVDQSSTQQGGSGRAPDSQSTPSASSTTLPASSANTVLAQPIQQPVQSQQAAQPPEPQQTQSPSSDQGNAGRLAQAFQGAQTVFSDAAQIVQLMQGSHS